MATLHRLACNQLLPEDRKEFLAICMGCASVGLLGAIYLISTLCRRSRETAVVSGWSVGFYLSKQQQHIVSCLGITDVLACIGVIGRSAIWYNIPSDQGCLPGLENAPYVIALEGLITFGYLNTFFWSCWYAIDIYSYMTERSRSLHLYHFVTWTFVSLLTAVALLSLFEWEDNKINVTCVNSTSSTIYRLTFLVPIVITILFLPLVYTLASRHTKEFVSGGGVMADMERRMMTIVKIKFFLFVAVFYLCWTPTIVNLCLEIFSSHVPCVHRIEHFNLWIVEATVNPLQAFFNGILYSKSTLWQRCVQGSDRSATDDLDTSYGTFNPHLPPPVLSRTTIADSIDTSVDNYDTVQWTGGRWRSRFDSLSSATTSAEEEKIVKPNNKRQEKEPLSRWTAY